MTAPRTSSVAARILAIGFGTTVAMWAVGYVAMMKPGLVLGEILFALILACLFAGGFFAGRFAHASESKWKSGFLVGFVSAILNLLLVGSLITSASEGDGLQRALMWIMGMYVASIVLAMFGSIISSSKVLAEGRDQKNWFHVFVCVAAATVFLLLTSGGLVTGLEAGLAVPDWPNSFGHNMLLYPLSEMTGEVYYEHAHRLYGTLVGVTGITLAVSMFFFDQRGWLRTLGIIYLVIVCVQGILGGTRVTETSIVLAIIHGIFGQLVFATIVAIAAFTSPTWFSPGRTENTKSLNTLRKSSSHFLGAIIVQLTLGAMFRHLNEQPEISKGLVHGVLGGHVLLALLILIGGISIGGRAWSKHHDVPVLSRLGLIFLFLLGLQVVLGVGALIAVLAARDAPDDSTMEIIITSIHQATGALLLATATLLMLWSRRTQMNPATT